jgi:hypothetical protein
VQANGDAANAPCNRDACDVPVRAWSWCILHTIRSRNSFDERELH